MLLADSVDALDPGERFEPRFSPPVALPLTWIGLPNALSQLQAGRPVGLRHPGGYALVAPASLTTAPFIEALETAAGSPVMLVLGADARPAIPAGSDGVGGLGSAASRAAAVRAILRDDNGPIVAGNLTVVKAHPEGVLRRGGRAAGAAEGALDLIRAAGFETGAIVAPVCTGPDAVARLDVLDVAFVCISELAALVRGLAAPVERVVTTRLPMPHGDFEAIGYRAALQGMEFVAAVRGAYAGAEEVPVSVHDGCLLGEALRSSDCGCRDRLRGALARIGRLPVGIVIRLQPDESTLFGDHGPPDPCRMAVVAQVIRDLGPASVVLVDTDDAIVAALAQQGCPLAA